MAEIRVRACLAVVRDGAILLVPHYETDAGGTQWCIPGGNVEFGETLREAAVREFLEETGLQSRALDLLEVTEVVLPEKPWHSVTVAFRGEILDGEVRAEPDHPFGKKVPRWLDANEIEHVACHPRQTVEKALNLSSGPTESGDSEAPAAPYPPEGEARLSNAFCCYPPFTHRPRWTHGCPRRT